MIKPRMNCKDGVYMCYSPISGDRWSVAGYGATPEEAYSFWKKNYDYYTEFWLPPRA